MTSSLIPSIEATAHGATLRGNERIDQQSNEGPNDRSKRGPSAAGLAAFRIAFGIAVAANAIIYLPELVHEHYGQGDFAVSYGPLTFVDALPGAGMHVVYVAMVITGGLIAWGRWYRSAMATFFLLTTYVFLVDATYFQNHEYLISLLSFVMIFLPANAMWSGDARRDSRIASPTVPAWSVWLLRFQIGVPYFFGGVAKLNGDWLRGEPLRMWLGNRTDVEPIASILNDPGFVWFAAYGAIALDLLAVPLLLWHRTRPAMYAALVVFHLVNAWVFGLYVFPWLMIAATTIFLRPDWPIRALARLRRPARRTQSAARESSVSDQAPPSRTRTIAIHSFLGLWVVLQLLVPLRHFAFAGNSSWTGEGHQFAWHMMLRSKSGTTTFEVRDGTRTWMVDPRDHLTSDQWPDVATQPVHLVQFAHHLSDLYGGAAVFAHSSVSLNGRDPQALVDPEVDLASVPTVWWGHADWILPLTVSLDG